MASCSQQLAQMKEENELLQVITRYSSHERKRFFKQTVYGRRARLAELSSRTPCILVLESLNG